MADPRMTTQNPSGGTDHADMLKRVLDHLVTHIRKEQLDSVVHKYKEYMDNLSRRTVEDMEKQLGPAEGCPGSSGDDAPRQEEPGDDMHVDDAPGDLKDESGE